MIGAQRLDGNEHASKRNLLLIDYVEATVLGVFSYLRLETLYRFSRPRCTSSRIDQSCLIAT